LPISVQFPSADGFNLHNLISFCQIWSDSRKRFIYWL